MSEPSPRTHSAQSIAAERAALSPLAPLRSPVFRMLWGIWVTANLCTWMHDVAAAWMMTSFTSTPLWVALVQTASTVPMFLLGLPSGALADILDRRRYFIVTQFWVAGVALVLCAVTVADAMTAPLLLALTFANGVGLAMRWPVFSAIVPELVPRAQLPAALGLNGIAMNASRIAGPLLAGGLIASAGTEYVFVLNAVLSVISGFAIMSWRRKHAPSPLGRERLISAMRVGLQFVGQSARLRAVLLRVFMFFFHSTALLALLPLVARGLHAGGAGVFTTLLASMGLGAITSVLLLPRLRRIIGGERLLLRGTLVLAVAMLGVTYAPHLSIAAPAMFIAGMVWIATVNSLSVSAQLALPDWVRARGMSIYQMAIMGASAAGAALWGQVATWSSVTTALTLAAFSGVIAIRISQWLVVNKAEDEDLTPSRELKVPTPGFPPGQGHVVMTIEYRIDPERAPEFLELMRESRRSRLRQGAINWELLRDIADPGRFTERVVDESWTEHLRRFDRLTAADTALRRRKLKFHIAESPPVVHRRIVELP